MRVFAISDQHYGHDNIIKYCKRSAPNADSDAISMIRAHNETVTDEDLVIFVGDVSCSQYGRIILPKIVPKLKGKKILVRGNHDHQNTIAYKRMGFLEVKDVLILGDFIFNHYPDSPKVLEIAAKRGLTLVCGHTHKPFNFKDGIKRINVAVDVMGLSPKYILEVPDAIAQDLGPEFISGKMLISKEEYLESIGIKEKQ